MSRFRHHGAGEAGIFEEIIRADFSFGPRRTSSVFVASMCRPGTDQFFGRSCKRSRRSSLSEGPQVTGPAASRRAVCQASYKAILLDKKPAKTS